MKCIWDRTLEFVEHRGRQRWVMLPNVLQNIRAYLPWLAAIRCRFLYSVWTRLNTAQRTICKQGVL